MASELPVSVPKMAAGAFGVWTLVHGPVPQETVARFFPHGACFGLCLAVINHANQGENAADDMDKIVKEGLGYQSSYQIILEVQNNEKLPDVWNKEPEDFTISQFCGCSPFCLQSNPQGMAAPVSGFGGAQIWFLLLPDLEHQHSVASFINDGRLFLFDPNKGLFEFSVSCTLCNAQFLAIRSWLGDNYSSPPRGPFIIKKIIQLPL